MDVKIPPSLALDRSSSFLCEEAKKRGGRGRREKERTDKLNCHSTGQACQTFHIEFSCNKAISATQVPATQAKA